jgi:cbb3-type cytochrome c oxidase subunit III
MSYLLALVFALLWTAAGQSATDEAEHVAAEQDAVDFSMSNIKRGKQLFTVHCVSCHGMDGRGDTEMREFLKTPPADLSDDQWTYSGSDAVLFDVVKEGRMARDMPAFKEKLSDQRIWQVVIYMKYLGGARP